MLGRHLALSRVEPELLEQAGQDQEHPVLSQDLNEMRGRKISGFIDHKQKRAETPMITEHWEWNAKLEMDLKSARACSAPATSQIVSSCP